MRTSLAVIALAAALGAGISACGTPAESIDSPTLATTPVEAGTADDAAPSSDDAADDTSATPTPAPAVKMPAVEGTNLQVSVYKLERKGFSNISPLPVDGHAFAANYANWVIVAQTPAAGKRVSTDVEVTLEVAKTDEAENSVCLDGDC